MYSPIPANPAIASNRAAIAWSLSPSTAAFTHTFSRPVNSGLNPAPSSRSAPIRPFTSRAPRVGRTVPQISCSSVDLPDPFRPIRPTVSPARTERSTSRTAQKSS